MSRFISDGSDLILPKLKKPIKESRKPPKKKPRALTESKAFVRFVAQRDAGLERVLAKYSVEISKIIDSIKLKAKEVASHMLITGIDPSALKRNREAFEHQMRPMFQMAVERTTGLVLSLRRTTFVISAVGQAHAIAKVLDQEPKLKIDRTHIADHKDKEMQLGGDVRSRIDLAYSRLLRDLIDALQMSQTMGESPKETLSRIERASPRAVAQKRAKRVMARMSESGSVPVGTFRGGSQGFDDDLMFFSPDEWDQAVEDYLADEVPFGRAPYDKVFYAEQTDEGIETYTRYQWQVEQEVTDDFIDSVRDGENEAANQAGIDDFQWLAITDSKTDECCFDRDGLTITEIEEGLDNGSIDGDECDATSAPGHFKCRCRMAPMSKDMPEESEPDFGAFDAWIEERGKEK